MADGVRNDLIERGRLAILSGKPFLLATGSNKLTTSESTSWRENSIFEISILPDSTRDKSRMSSINADNIFAITTGREHVVFFFRLEIRESIISS